MVDFRGLVGFWPVIYLACDLKAEGELPELMLAWGMLRAFLSR